MLYLLLCVISVLTAPHADINFLLVFEEHFIVNVVKVGPCKHLHGVILKHGLYGYDLGLPLACALCLIVYPILIECFNIFIHMSEDPIQVQNQEQLFSYRFECLLSRSYELSWLPLNIYNYINIYKNDTSRHCPQGTSGQVTKHVFKVILGHLRKGKPLLWKYKMKLRIW